MKRSKIIKRFTASLLAAVMAAQLYTAYAREETKTETESVGTEAQENVDYEHLSDNVTNIPPEKDPKYIEFAKHLKEIFPDGKYPSIKSLKEQKAMLQGQRSKQQEALTPYAEQRRTMQIVTHNVSAILGRNIIERQQEQL